MVATSPPMKAVNCDRYGGPGALAVRENDIPVPGDNDAFVRVEATGGGAFAEHARIAVNKLAPEPPHLNSEEAGTQQLADCARAASPNGIYIAGTGPILRTLRAVVLGGSS